MKLWVGNHFTVVLLLTLLLNLDFCQSLLLSVIYNDAEVEIQYGLRECFQNLINNFTHVFLDVLSAHNLP